MIKVGDYVNCPICKAKIKVFEIAPCAYCGKIVAKAWCSRCEEVVYVCPQCGYTTELAPDETVKCPRCGTEIHSECAVF